MTSMTDDEATATCAGKDFEYHERVKVRGALESWTCPACGDTGAFGDTFKKLATLLPLLRRLKTQLLDGGAVFLLPSGATPGKLGEFYGCDVLRAPGLPGPMIGLAPWDVLAVDQLRKSSP
jgi:hypothetical protein